MDAKCIFKYVMETQESYDRIKKIEEKTNGKLMTKDTNRIFI